eukprot:2841294-Rhodomonas_salina.4
MWRSGTDPCVIDAAAGRSCARGFWLRARTARSLPALPVLLALTSMLQGPASTAHDAHPAGGWQTMLEDCEKLDLKIQSL